MKQRVTCIFVLITIGLFALISAPAQAQDASLTRAQAHYDKAALLFSQGKYKQAAVQFETAYEARPFAQFLFNIAASYEKLKAYDNAIKYYEKYLQEAPKAKDKKKVRTRIRVLAEEAKREKSPANPDKPSPAAKLDDVSIRGLVVIESRPRGANIYLDSRKREPLSKTPWNGTLEGEHTIFLELRGYEPVERRFAPNPKQLTVLWFALAKEDYLGWIDIRSNVPGAKIYLDDKSQGVYGTTPFGKNLKPGKHKIWVSAEGYDEYYEEIEIVQGKTHEINAKLRGSPVGYVNFRGRGIENATIYMNRKVLCQRGPCRKAVKQGKHVVRITRSGYKTYTRKIDVQPRTETTIAVNLAKKPGRMDAYVAYGIAAVFTGVGIWAGHKSNSIRDDLDRDIQNGMPPPDRSDSRFDRGKYYAIGANVGYALGGLTFITAVYYTFRDKGPASTGTAEVQTLSVQPRMSPTYAGMGLEVNW